MAVAAPLWARQRLWPDADPLEVAWAAGFFDGEGTTYLEQSSGQVLCACKQSPARDETVPRVLERFQRAVGVGTIGGPYPQPGNRRTVFMWYARAAAAVDALSILWPQLGQVKRDQALRAIGVS